MAIDPLAVIQRANELARMWVPYAPQWAEREYDAPAIHSLLTAISEAIEAEVKPLRDQLEILLNR